MQKSSGVWVDHRRAVVVSLIDDRQSVDTVDSGIDSQPPDTTGGRGANPGSPTRIPEGKPDNAMEEHLKKFYRDVADKLDGATSIFIFGPGQAKNEFRKHLESNKRFSDIEIEVGPSHGPAQAMTTDEVTRETLQHFRPEQQ